MSTREETTKTDSPDVRVEELDCSGLLCPLPVYQAGIVLERLGEGDRLRLITTDPGALQDIPAMTRQRGDQLISIDEADGRQIFIVQKGGAT